MRGLNAAAPDDRSSYRPSPVTREHEVITSIGFRAPFTFTSTSTCPFVPALPL